MKRIFKVGVLFSLFIAIVFILSLVVFSILDNFIPLDNRIVRYLIITFGSILGVYAMQLIIKRSSD